MRLIGLAVILTLNLALLPFAAEAQEDQFAECLQSQLLKEIRELEGRIKRERETPIGERITKPTDTPEQRLERMRRELSSLRPLYCETFRCGRWIGTACD
jgi:hypothetical protein